MGLIPPTSGRSSARSAASTFEQAAGYGEATLLALPFRVVPEVLEGLDDRLRGRTLIDCTNGVDMGEFVRPMAADVARISGAHVVKAFNLCHVDVWRMEPPVFGGRPLAVPLCGDDERALAAARALAADLGCEPFYAGGLERAGLAESAMAFLVGLWFRGLDAQAVIPPLAYAEGVPRSS
ncbi:NADP oxidoreductase [Nonomuraea sp. NBC_01738]|uniref:NADPH-dependent F420 reductase n=1 Tax=Nonomuraea sp. NBC_01738 TaxID=2976003 RepID=UPI002E145625|nr:NADP oxidoreductase [Nonomuraea sp. NBC_01738]